MQPSLASNLLSYCLSLLNAGIADVDNHTQLFRTFPLTVFSIRNIFVFDYPNWHLFIL
jgi:hypothetical protein